MTDWNAWSRIVDAAGDPQHRDAVQNFLAQAELSADIPAALDEKFLAPMRPAGATEEQCAYLLCNLGFAALVTGSGQSAAFALACGRVAERLAPDVPDLVLRRLFLSVKGTLVVAVLTDQPHFSWDDVTAQCAAYLRAIDRHLETLPAEAIEGNAMAAYSFAGTVLSRIAGFRATGHYAGEVASLVSAALRLEDRLPSTLPGRIWSTIMPGTDARDFFLETGAEAERALHVGGASAAHARQGLDYIDETLSRPADRDSSRFLQRTRTRAELLLQAGRFAEAAEVADSLRGSPDRAARLHATLVDAKRHLLSGDPEAAAGLLAQSSPAADLAVDAWLANWTEDADEGHWTHRSDALPRFEDIREAWVLEAVAAAGSDDAPGFLGAIDRAGGFLADSFRRDRQQWTRRLARSTDRRPPSPEGHPAQPGEPAAALDEILDGLGEGTALLQVAGSEECVLTLAARRRGGDILFSRSPRRDTATGLRKAHKAWSRAHFEAFRHRAGGPDGEADCAAAFAGLLDEVDRTWGDVLGGLLEDGVTQLVLLGDDLVDIPLHAARTGTGDERLIDRVAVTHVPSLNALRACMRRTPVDTAARSGIGLRCLVDADTHAEAVDALAATLGTDAVDVLDPRSASLREDATAAHVLHLVAGLDHNAGRPFDSMLNVGEHELSLGRFVSGLALRQCEIVSSLACESALPTMLRAPGLDLAALFLAAGAGHVLASSWATKDEPASAMTRAFFEYWVAGQAPAAAFRQALEDLRSGRSSLPDYCWAGMRLVGAP